MDTKTQSNKKSLNVHTKSDEDEAPEDQDGRAESRTGQVSRVRSSQVSKSGPNSETWASQPKSQSQISRVRRTQIKDQNHANVRKSYRSGQKVHFYKITEKSGASRAREATKSSEIDQKSAS